jgi:hypothetical protein
VEVHRHHKVGVAREVVLQRALGTKMKHVGRYVSTTGHTRTTAAAGHISTWCGISNGVVIVPWRDPTLSWCGHQSMTRAASSRATTPRRRYPGDAVMVVSGMHHARQCPSEIRAGCTHPGVTVLTTKRDLQRSVREAPHLDRLIARCGVPHI